MAARRPATRWASRNSGTTANALNTAAGTRSQVAWKGTTALHALINRKYSGGLFSVASIGQSVPQGCWLQYTVKGSSWYNGSTPSQLHFNTRFSSSRAASSRWSVRCTGRSYPPVTNRRYIT